MDEVVTRTAPLGRRCRLAAAVLVEVVLAARDEAERDGAPDGEESHQGPAGLPRGVDRRDGADDE